MLISRADYQRANAHLLELSYIMLPLFPLLQCLQSTYSFVV